ncbi:hypothetical protein BOV94_01800, partial [Solemya velum gill symbiont]
MRHPFLLGLFVFLQSAASYALTLGQVHVDSYINEPLKAAIEIKQAKASELATLKAQLASKAEFARASLEWDAQTDALQVQFDRNSKNPRILVTTATSVSDPFLSFVVEASWSTGKTLRDYTILLDPPTYAMSRVAPVDPIVLPVPEKARLPVAKQPSVPSVSAKPPVRTQPASPAVGALMLARTRKGDHLWTYATFVKPDGVTVQQTVVGLLEANPN